MKFDTISFLQDYNIPYIEQGSTITSRYVGLDECPFCGAKASGNKVYGALGRTSTSYSCWICHERDFYGAIQRLTGITNYEELQKIYKRYGIITSGNFIRSEKESIIRPTKIDVPGSTEMLRNARKYIAGRGFNPEYLWQKYDLRNTAMHSHYGYRVVIPLKYNNRIISYTARDYTGLQDPKVKACKLDLEIIPHKDMLFGIDYAKYKNVVVLEGEWDQMRVSDGSVATYGTEVTLPQLILLASKFDNIFFLFDGGESEALRHAYVASTILTSFGKHVEVLEMDSGDPDEVFADEKELLYLKKDLQLY